MGRQSSSGPRRIAAIAAAWVVLAWPSAARAQAQRLFLPLLETPGQPAPPEPCALAALSGCDHGAGWRLTCGGFGAVRELVSLQDEPGTVLAVGDGAARFRWHDGRPTWTAQLNVPMTGMRAAVVSPQLDLAWAAGMSGQIALARSGCWELAPFLSPQVDLNAIRVDKLNASSPFDGWAVGRWCDGDDVPCAGIALRLRDMADPKRWEVRWGPGLLPPLLDVAQRRVLSGPGNVVTEAWAVGGRWPDERRASGAEACPPSAEGFGSGGFFRLGPGERGRPTAVCVPGEGLPQQLVLIGAEGLALGADATGRGVAAWKLDVDAARTRLAGTVLGEGALTDLYFAHLDRDFEDDTLRRLWMGVAPAAEASVVHLLEWIGLDAPLREPLGAPVGAAGLPGDVADGGGAMAPIVRAPADGGELQLDGLLYAWGPGAWRRDQASGAWERVRRRRDLIGLAVTEDGPLALSREEDGGARLLRYAGGELRELEAYRAWLDGLRGVRGLAQGPSGVWLATEGGPARLSGGADGRLYGLPDAARGELMAMALDPEGRVQALVGSGNGGPSQSWRLDPASGHWAAGPASVPGLKALSAGPGGEVWAVGPDLAQWSRPGCDLAPAPSAWRCRCVDAAAPFLVCELDLARLESADDRDLRAVAADGAGAAWAVGQRNLIRLRAPGTGQSPVRYPPSEPAVLAHGAQLRGLALESGQPGSPVWVMGRCGRWTSLGAEVTCGRQDPAFGIVARFLPRGDDPTAGRWDESAATTVDVDLNAMAGGRSPDDGRPAMWLAGDWTTLAWRASGGGE